MKETMARAIGVGGVFLRAADPEKLHAWYEEHLGIKRTEDGAFAFFSEGPREMTVGKNNSKAGGAKRSSTSFARSIPSLKTLHRPGDGR
jgi:hypothetical protein